MCAGKFSWFHLICEILLTVNGYNVDDIAEHYPFNRVFFNVLSTLVPACTMFRVNSVNLHLQNDVQHLMYTIYIYENSSVQLASVGLA